MSAADNSLLVREFADLIYKDEVLLLLINQSAEKDFIEPNRMRNNFRRLLQHYAKDLKLEAKNSEHRVAAAFVGQFATKIAIELFSRFPAAQRKLSIDIASRPELIDNRQKVEEFLKNLFRTEEIRDNSDNEEGIEEVGAEEDVQYDGSLRELHHITEFFVQSSAFLTLRQKLHDFVHPSMTTELRAVVRAWLEPGNKRSELVKLYKLPTLITELQYIPTSQIRLQSKEEAVDGYFKSMVKSFKGKVESWTMEPWDWWPLGPTKRLLGDKEARVYWTCSGLDYGLAQIDVESLSCSRFFRDLRSSYFDLRGTLRTWFSVWRYSHCDFYMCEKFEDHEFVPKQRDRFPEPSNIDYDFVPRHMMEDRMPPVTPHEFYRRFYACRHARPALHFYHQCRPLGGGHSRDLLDLFPKKRSELEEGGDDRSVFWGIYAREAVSTRWVICYNLACALPLLAFFFMWVLRQGADEIQNASVPISIMLAMLSMFWSVFFSSLQFGRPQ
ncbi:nucleoside phosphorylase domain protein [Colletotrichum tofieldiae]|nr:nucleoside phosphorylase domain protein [Colletotrichum tofieldiae]